MTEAEWLRIGVGGIVPVHWEVSKAGDGPGTVSGWASVYNVVDQQDDIVLPGAFKKTLAEWRQTGRTVPLVLDHEHTSEGVIGSMTAMTETSYGLKFTAKFSSVPRAQDARTKVVEGDLAGLSIYGPIYKKAYELRDGRELRLLQQLGLMEVSLTPFAANVAAMVTASKAVSDTPWSQFSEADYTPEQWRRACLIDTGEGQVTVKSRYKLPVREPGGALNRNAVHAAAGGHGVSAVTGVAAEVKRAAARKLVGLYKQLGEDPPEGLVRLAGTQASASLALPDGWVADMRQALSISVPLAQKAAVDVLVAAQYGLDDDTGGDDGGDDPPVDGDGAEDDAAKYALSVVDGLPSAPADPIDAILAEAGQDSVSADLAALEAELTAGR